MVWADQTHSWDDGKGNFGGWDELKCDDKGHCHINPDGMRYAMITEASPKLREKLGFLPHEFDSEPAMSMYLVIDFWFF